MSNQKPNPTGHSFKTDQSTIFFAFRQLITSKIFTIPLLFNVLCFINLANGQTVTLPSGSFLIQTGSTVASGLKPYGLVYQLVTVNQVPVYWCINTAKIKDGPDFTHNNVTYSGGTFAVNANYITPAVASVIAGWQTTNGVVGNYSVSPITVPVYDTITTFPRLILDNTSLDHTVLINYFTNAGIPSSAYTLGGPSGLNSCFDMFASPHSDAPTWSSHGFLRNFSLISRGNIWLQCHQVSVIEGLCDPNNTAIRLNFLTTNGLGCYKTNTCGCLTGPVHAKNRTDPTSYFFPAHPIMQFLGSLDDASNDGNEKWFIPNVVTGSSLNSVWNTQTNRGVKTSDGVAPAEGAMLVYGPAYGNTTNGMVMYQAAHDLNNGTETSKVSAQRPFFNYMLLTGLMKGLTATSTLPPTVLVNSTNTFTATVTNGLPPYTYQWSSQVGAFSSPNSATTSYSAPALTTGNDTTIEVRLRVTDGCGRVNIILYNLTVTPSLLPVTLLDFKVFPNNASVRAEWKTMSEENNDFFTLERSRDALVFESLVEVNGAGNSSMLLQYAVDDPYPLQGVAYYRLRQTDYDGSFAYSDILPINMNSSQFAVFPNPATHALYVSLNSPEQLGFGPIELKLVDIAGRTVFHERLFRDSGGEGIIGIPVSGLSKGLYTLVAESMAEVWKTRVVID